VKPSPYPSPPPYDGPNRPSPPLRSRPFIQVAPITKGPAPPFRPFVLKPKAALVTTPLFQFDPTQEEQSILGQIYREQSEGLYNVLYGFTRFTEFTTFPDWAGVTVNGSPTHAAGAGQDEPETWAAAQAATGVPDFSPASQDVVNLWLLREYGQASQWATSFADDGWIYGFAAQGPFA
jgi:hypothetical protein